MPLSSQNTALLGAGIFGIVCAATLYVVEHYSQERRRHALARDVARLNDELSGLRNQLDKLIKSQKENRTKHKVSHGNRKAFKANSVLSSSTTDNYLSAAELDSSDLEFYDLSDNDLEQSPLEVSLLEIDLNLEKGDTPVLENTLDRLKNLCIEHPEDPNLLWRIGKAHYKLHETTDDKDARISHINKGIDACTVALNYKPELSDVHKWLAILIGSRTDYQPVKEKIQDGNMMKLHTELALKLSPEDPILHHMLGRFQFEMASMKWYERKVASALFGDLPTSTFEQALKHLLEAETYSKHPWKSNKLSVAKCQIMMGDFKTALDYLEQAQKIITENGEDSDDKEDVEIKELIDKYESYR